MRSNESAKRITLIGMFTAIIFLLTFTPIGFIQLPFIKAMIIHIPVIFGSIILGASVLTAAVVPFLLRIRK